jgi:signal transduction histidine kinase/ligand-binding sensor domain-containing protein
MISRPIWVNLISALCTLPIVAFSQGLVISPVEDARDVITSTVQGMTQDKQGFLWLGTRNGLFRYDGRSFVTYRHDPFANSLIFDNIENVICDSAGFIWIAPFYHGLDRLDPITGTFKHFGHSKKDPKSLASDTIASMLTDYAGTIWVATYEGLDRLDKGSDKFIHYRFDPSDSTSISCSNVRTLYEDKDSVLWIGTGNVFRQEDKAYKTLGGLNRFDRKTGKFTRYLHHPENEHSLIDNRVTTLFEDSRGTFWVGTAGDGLHTMDRRTGSFTRHRYDPLQPNRLSRPPLQPSFEWAEDFISLITESFDGHIIIGTFSNGINVYDRTSQKTYWYGSDANATVKLRDHLFWRSYTTRDKTVWISAWDGNLYRVTRGLNPITFHNADSVVISLLEDDNETLWIGSLNGLVKQEKNGTRTRYLMDTVRQSFDANLVFPLRLEGSTMILETPYGLRTFDTKTSLLSRYLPNAAVDGNGMLSDTISAMVKTKNGDYFFSTFRGLNMLDHKTKMMRGFRYDRTDTTSISSNLVHYLVLDHEDNVWTGGNAGVCLFDKSKAKFKRYHIGTIIHLLVDSQGTIWASGTGGLFHYDELVDNFVRYKDPYQVIPSSVSGGSIFEDRQNNLWWWSSIGIIQIPAGKDMRPVVHNWDHTIDLDNFTLGVVRHNGNIVFGSLHGYYEISPALFREAKANHTITIERFVLNDAPLYPSNQGVLTKPVYKTKEVKLSHDQNTFSFGFTDIDFSGVKRAPVIVYKLDPYDHEWRTANASNSAQYFNIEAGSYQFTVKSFDIYGNASEAGMLIEIAPPWWNTTGAYVGWAITALGIASLIYMSRISSLRKQQAAQIRVMVAIQEDERKRISRDLHDDVGTKLSALKLFLTSLREKTSTHGDPEVDALARTTEQFIGETMADVRTLLANLSPAVLEEFGYIVAVEGLINKLNETRPACFRLSVFGMHSRLKPAYELALYRITQELINNVMKHASACSVSVQIGRRDEKIILMIEDDGNGFDVATKTGGYGLKNLMARCKLMHGSITIDSHPGMGTSVLIEIPYDAQSI